MKIIKLLTLTISFSFLLSSIYACARENNQQGNNTKETQIQLANNQEKEPKILDITNVGTAKTGKAVDFEWIDDGKTFKFSEVTKNKVVFLNFWATWCGPCRMEIPDIIELNKELPKKDFIIISVALDNRGTLEQVRNLVKSFAKQMKINYHIFLPTKDIVSPYGDIPGIPTTFIIDKKGNIIEKIVGARDKATFLKSINKIIK